MSLKFQVAGYNAISRQEVEQLGSSFVCLVVVVVVLFVCLFFPLFPVIVARVHAHSSWGKSSIPSSQSQPGHESV